MNNVTLIPNIALRDQYGNQHPQAQIAILEVVINNHWSMKGEKVGDVYSEDEQAGGITYRVAFYGNPQAQAKGFPICPLLDYQDGQFSDVLTADANAPEIQAILNGTADKKAKGIAIVRAALAKRPR